MNMKRLTYIFFAVFIFTSCDDFLNKTDPTATTFVEFFNDEDDLRRVAYSSFRDVFTSESDRRLLFYMKDGRSDNAYARISGDHHQSIANGNLRASSRLSEYYYTLRMKHIGRLNTYIDNIDAPYVEDESVRDRYENILKGLRIWHYFILTSRFGDVPFRLEPATLDEATVPATPKEEILDVLFEDGQEIAANLPKDEYSTNKYFFNEYSLKALLMRYALYNERYDLAIKLAEDIMESGRYSLHPVYGDLFNYNASSSNNEFIIHMDRESNGGSSNSFQFLGPHYRTGNGQSYAVPLKSLVDSYWTLQGDPIDDSPLYSKEDYELNPQLNRDPRYSASIFGHGDIFYGDTIDIYNSNSPMYYNADRASSSGYWFKKFVDEADAFRGSGNMEYGMLRYAEVLLTYAEAKIMKDEIDDSVKDLINQIRERAGLDMEHADVTLPKYDGYTQDDWIELIRNERRIELAGEGVRYDDIIRWRIAEDVLNQPALGHTRQINGELVSLKIEDRSFEPHMYLWPFHESSLKVNPNLEQNPGY